MRGERKSSPAGVDANIDNLVNPEDLWCCTSCSREVKTTTGTGTVSRNHPCYKSVHTLYLICNVRREAAVTDDCGSCVGWQLQCMALYASSSS